MEKDSPEYWADWLVDAVAGSTQDRRLLRGDPEETKVVTDAIYLNALRAIRNARACGVGPRGDHKFTPGPWEFNSGFVFANGDALKVAGVQVPHVCGKSRIEAIHNSILIAAAPTLLSALEEIEKFTRDVPEDHYLSHVCGVARAAISIALPAKSKETA